MSEVNLIESTFDFDDVLQFSYNRKKDDYMKVSPIAGTNLNRSGDITFQIEAQSSYISLSDSFLKCEFTITKADGTALGTDDITLENNFFPRCFNQMILKVGGKDVESISQDPGEASTIANFIITSETYKRTYGQISSWIPDTNKGDTTVKGIEYNSGYYLRKKLYNDKKKFTMMFPLKNIFGFTEYTKILYNLKIHLVLGKKDNVSISEDVFYGGIKTAAVTTGTAAPAVYYDAKLQFDTLEWYIPSTEPSLDLEKFIVSRLETNKPIDIVFMKRNMNALTIPTGGNYTWPLGSYDNSVRFIFVAFKTIDASSTSSNNALFTTHVGTDKITSLRAQLGTNHFYPIDRMKMDFLNADILEPYVSYINCCQMFGNEPQLTVQEFKDLYPIFCFDVSAQPKGESNSVSVNLHIEKSSALQLKAYALLLEDCRYKIDVLGGKMIRVQ